MVQQIVRGIYEIRCTTSLWHYFGSSKDIVGRLRQHIADLRHDHHENPILQRVWNKHGESAFEFLILEEMEPGEDLLAVEQEYLDAGFKTRRMMNINRRAAKPPSMKGIPKSAEAKRRLSDAAYRVAQDPAVRARRSAALTGIRRSDACIARMKEARNTPEAKAAQGERAQRLWKDPEYREKVLAHPRAKPSEAVKAAIREGQRRNFVPIEGIDVKTGEVVEFESVRAAIRAGFIAQNLQQCLAGKRKTHRGRAWQRL
jgi:group I intron endonuclease